jgi:hypothetical protein
MNHGLMMSNYPTFSKHKSPNSKSLKPKSMKELKQFYAENRTAIIVILILIGLIIIGHIQSTTPEMR